MSGFLHIVAFDIPYPPNYGGAIDVFFRIKALSESGVKIILHCFEYKRDKSVVLEDMCERVYYYKRNTSLVSHFSILPYTVISRKNRYLLANLLKDDYPILFDGLMSCYYLNAEQLRNRTKIYREANIEHNYYFELFRATRFSIEKMYYFVEAAKFALFERLLKKVHFIFAISAIDSEYYAGKFPNAKVTFIPCFHSNQHIDISCDKGDYILYHGNLSVPENEKAVEYLYESVFSKLSFRCVIAGMNPSGKLLQLSEKYSNVEIIANPDDEQLKTLVRNAQVHILVTFQSTGLKIKLLNTLFAGKHVVVNDQLLAGSGLSALCYTANTAVEQIDYCNKLMMKPFTQQDASRRSAVLLPRFSNDFLALEIKNILNL